MNFFFFFKPNGYDRYTETALIVMLLRVKNTFIFMFCSKVVSHFCKYSVIKHLILFTETVHCLPKYLQIKHAISKGFHPSVNHSRILNIPCALLMTYLALSLVL